MLYLKGLVTFTPPSASFTNITRQDPSERDPKGLRESYDSFNELIARYPDSRYTADAKKRVTWLVNTIAQNEVHVATYYYERSEEHTSELQSLMRIPYAVFCMKKKIITTPKIIT